MWGTITALVSGALMSIQGVFNTEVTKQTGSLFDLRGVLAVFWQGTNRRTASGGA